jgi:hypothetical protein
MVRIVSDTGPIIGLAKQEEILQDYPQLDPDDFRAALLYKHHKVAREDVFDRVAFG